MFKRKNHTATPTEIRRGFQAFLDYWDGRIRIGDPLFDQGMHDAREAAIDGLAVMDKLEKAGYNTGKNIVNTSLMPFKIIDVSWHRFGKEISYMTTIDGRAKVGTSVTIKGDVEQGLIDAICTSWLGKSIDNNTKFKFKEDRYFGRS